MVLVTGTPVEDQGTTGLAMTVPSTEEKPMKIDAPAMNMYQIWQSSSLPCDSNTITVTVTTNTTNFNKPCNTTVTITGLDSALTKPGNINTNWTWTANGQRAFLNVTDGQFQDGNVVVVMPYGPTNNFKVQFELVNPKTQ